MFPLLREIRKSEQSQKISGWPFETEMKINVFTQFCDYLVFSTSLKAVNIQPVKIFQTETVETKENGGSMKDTMKHKITHDSFSNRKRTFYTHPVYR